LTSALDGGEWSASHPGCFTSRERAPQAHRTDNSDVAEHSKIKSAFLAAMLSYLEQLYILIAKGPSFAWIFLKTVCNEIMKILLFYTIL
jgi:hypothetical protein